MEKGEYAWSIHCDLDAALGQPHADTGGRMKIVVVNVERAADRRRRIVAGLEELGLEHVIWPAVDWRDLTPS